MTDGGGRFVARRKAIAKANMAHRRPPLANFNMGETATAFSAAVRRAFAFIKKCSSGSGN